jgi:hypothetical protein
MTMMTSNPETLAASLLPQPVDRARRARFILLVVGFCLITSALCIGIVAMIGVAPMYLPLMELFISGMQGLAMATTLAYVGGSVVDYNGGVGNMMTPSKRPSQAEAYAVPDEVIDKEAKG